MKPNEVNGAVLPLDPVLAHMTNVTNKGNSSAQTHVNKVTDDIGGLPTLEDRLPSDGMNPGRLPCVKKPSRLS
jgi:hypothetical protein